MTSQRVERTWICKDSYGRFRGKWVNKDLLLLLLLLLIIAELSGRHKQSPIVLGGEDQSLGIKDTLSIGPVDTH